MNNSNCIDAEANITDTFYNIIRILQLFCSIILLILLIKLVLNYKLKTFKIHKNLFVILFTYSDPCDCLIQVWLVYLIRMPAFTHVTGSPLFHVAIMIERIIATIFVKIYENKGKIISIVSTFIVWTILTFVFIFIYITNMMDVNTYSHPMVYITITSTTYSLSQSYQAKQNILVMNIIFPLDFSYTFVFAIFNTLASFFRSKREEYGQLFYIRSIDVIYLVNKLEIINIF
ncbi:hypothetical protein Mgra_00007062 [Meloidogyne graminicola]|uniref:Uncharacterized protein n=1 Tax=Meloidogyne graminicola TaxID=189291 RepID=A0A8S9ZJN7_9BILA|nr:hypothetical protein Mgra_00007062 [Meloidogyne graminicola]